MTAVPCLWCHKGFAASAGRVELADGQWSEAFRCSHCDRLMYVDHFVPEDLTTLYWEEWRKCRPSPTRS